MSQLNYKRWVSDDDDITAQIAYCIYKEKKCGYYEHTLTQRGKLPTKLQIETWRDNTYNLHKGQCETEAEARLKAFVDTVLRTEYNGLLLDAQAESSHGFWMGVWQNIMANILWLLIVTMIFMVLQYSNIDVKPFLQGLLNALPDHKPQ